MTTPHHCSTGILLAVLAAVLLSGCIPFQQKKVASLPPTEQVQPAPPPKIQKEKDLPTARFRNRRYYVHQVRWPNESLELIAQWYTGRRVNWKALAQATPNLRQNRLYQGHVVFIPIDLLQIETPMPRQYVQQHSSKPPPTPAVRSSGGTPQPKPYGPRPFPKEKSP